MRIILQQLWQLPILRIIAVIVIMHYLKILQE